MLHAALRNACQSEKCLFIHTSPIRHAGRAARSSRFPRTDAQNRGRSYATQSQEAAQKLNVFVKDLYATLDAHRRWNRSSAFRYAIDKLPEDHGTDREGPPPKYPAVSQQRVFLDSSSETVVAEYASGTGHVKDVEYGSNDYEGQMKPLTPEWAIRGELDDVFQRPWLLYKAPNTSKNAFQDLSHELQAFESYMSLTPEEEEAGSAVRTEIDKAMRHHFSVRTVGSRKRGLASPLSDLDLVISPDQAARFVTPINRGLRGGNLEKATAIAMLKRVERTCREKKIVSESNMIYARLPLLQMTHAKTGLKLQVKGPIVTDIQDELLADYMSELVYLKPIFTALRHCLQMRGLTTVFEGGLGSYSLLMMIIGALKMHEDQLESKSLAEGFLIVVKYWADFDCYTEGLIIDPPRRFNKKDFTPSCVDLDWPDSQEVCLQKMKRHYDERPFLLCLQDPADFTNDLGRKSYAIKHIQKTLRTLYDEAMRPIKESSDAPVYQSGNDSMLAPFLQGNYHHFEQQRSQTEWLLRAKRRTPRAEFFPNIDQRKRHNLSDEDIKEDRQKRAQLRSSGDHDRAVTSKENLEKSIRQYQMGNYFRTITQETTYRKIGGSRGTATTQSALTYPTSKDSRAQHRESPSSKEAAVKSFRTEDGSVASEVRR